MKTNDPALHDPTPATRGFLASVLRPVMENIGKELKKLHDKNTQALESAERRLSRHADHLAKIESRLQSLEHK